MAVMLWQAQAERHGAAGHFGQARHSAGRISGCKAREDATVVVHGTEKDLARDGRQQSCCHDTRRRLQGSNRPAVLHMAFDRDGIARRPFVMRRMTLARRKGLRSGALSAVIVWAAACSLALHAGRSPAQDWHLPALDGSPSFALSREVVPVPASAQSLLELTDIALRNNPRTRLAWATVRSRAAALGVARAAYWPQLDATLSASYSRTNSSSTGMPGNDLTRYGPAISLSYLLWDFGARASEAAAGEAELLGARLVLRSEER